MNPLVPKEGWHCLHQIYQVQQQRYSQFSPAEQAQNQKKFLETISSFKSLKDTQVLFYSIVGRADFGFMALTPNLQDLDAFEKKISQSFGPGVLKTEYSFYSLTEESEYKLSDADQEQAYIKEGMIAGSPELAAKMEEHKTRMAKYRHERVYPTFDPSWNIVCFYPMLKRRSGEQNWYALTYDQRANLMKGHAKLGRTFHGRVKQIITGAAGLGDWEWGVTLFSNHSDDIKAIVYEMRFDEVSYKYGEFGPFYIGILLSPQELLERILV
jgi:chlorite dismutase